MAPPPPHSHLNNPSHPQTQTDPLTNRNKMTPQPPRSPPHQTAPTLLMTKKMKIIMNVLPMNRMNLQQAPVESRTHPMVDPTADPTKIMEMSRVDVRLGYMYPYLYLYVVSLLLVHTWSHQYTPLQRTTARA